MEMTALVVKRLTSDVVVCRDGEVQIAILALGALRAGEGRERKQVSGASVAPGQETKGTSARCCAGPPPGMQAIQSHAGPPVEGGPLPRPLPSPPHTHTPHTPVPPTHLVTPITHPATEPNNQPPTPDHLPPNPTITLSTIINVTSLSCVWQRESMQRTDTHLPQFRPSFHIGELLRQAGSQGGGGGQAGV